MPVSVTFEEPTRFVIEGTGDISGTDAIRAFEQVRAHPSFGAGTTVLAVAHHVTSAPRTDELRDMVASVIALRNGGMVGFVVVTDPGFTYGVARMFSALADLSGVPIEVFLDVNEARTRLDELASRAA